MHRSSGMELVGMSEKEKEERISIVLRSKEMGLFNEIKRRMMKTKGFSTNTEVTRYLMKFYLRNSPLFKREEF